MTSKPPALAGPPRLNQGPGPPPELHLDKTIYLMRDEKLRYMLLQIYELFDSTLIMASIKFSAKIF